jgi:hypothetical protein
MEIITRITLDFNNQEPQLHKLRLNLNALNTIDLILQAVPISRLWILGVVLLLSACGEAGISLTEPAAELEASPIPTQPSPSAIPSLPYLLPSVEVPMLPNPTSSTPIDQALLSLAVNDLAQRLSVPPEDIHLVKFEAVTWPDGGLGCPEPGMNYTQVQVEGALIVLRAGDNLYEYHSGGSRPPFLCEPGRSTTKDTQPGLEITLPPADIES